MNSQSTASSMQIVSPKWLAIAGATLSAFCLYLATAAPGLTWAHHGADGGELLVAAVTNGVPHPPGYPLYMMLLQAWLWLTGLILPGAELAWRGNLFSVCCAALSAGITVRVAAALLPLPHDPSLKGQSEATWRWGWAFLVGLAWSVAPLPWSQALITEVYALHMIFLALLGWIVLVERVAAWWLIPVMALGVAHHLTFLLLLPAALYYIWCVRAKTMTQRSRYLIFLVVGGLLGLLFHLRTPLAAAMSIPSPVNWGYPDNWEGFWWLVSGAAYRSYLFGAPSSTLLTRVAAWAGTITAQFTPVGLAVMLLGLSYWDRRHPHLRNWSLIWLAPISIYAINYYTRDSEIYLLPVVWLTTLWLGVGLVTLYQWLVEEWPNVRRQVRREQGQDQGKTKKTNLAGRGTEQSDAPPPHVLPLSAVHRAQIRNGLTVVTLVGLCLLVGWRWSTISARADLRAQIFLEETIAVLEPGSIIISSADAETFTLWYGAWGSGTLLVAHPDTVLLNYALYQFPWYRRLIAMQYPEIVGESSSIEEILALNPDRPVFFSEQFSFWPTEQMEAVGPIWRYVAPE